MSDPTEPFSELVRKAKAKNAEAATAARREADAVRNAATQARNRQQALATRVKEEAHVIAQRATAARIPTSVSAVPGNQLSAIYRKHTQTGPRNIGMVAPSNWTLRREARRKQANLDQARSKGKPVWNLNANYVVTEDNEPWDTVVNEWYFLTPDGNILSGAGAADGITGIKSNQNQNLAIVRQGLAEFAAKHNLVA